jgi:SAM-dependent MidA family methyltransferase
MSLEEIIIQKIKTGGPISFRDFMEAALYYPELGYYNNQTTEKIGIRGDFYTSSTYCSIFGRMLAIQLEEMWCALGQPPFVIVEYGAGTGVLCRDILEHLEQNELFFKRLQYVIIEKSPALRCMQQQQLKGNDVVRWTDDIGSLGHFTGCILSNELLDNFSVYRVLKKEDGLKEILVHYEDGFTELLQPARQELKDYFKELKIDLPAGYEAEVNLEAIDWIKEITVNLESGFVLTIDYGYPSPQLYSRRNGTLMCYHQHKASHCAYLHIGDQDITAHVNFSAIDCWGQKNKLHLNGFTSQAYFLHALGISRELSSVGQSKASRNFIQAFMLDMGTKLKVMIQEKNKRSALLSGLRFGGNLKMAQ